MIHIKTLALVASTLLHTNCTNTVSDNCTNLESSISEELDSSDVFNDKVLYGNWFTPHEASVMNITFNRDNTFKMKDYKKDERDIIFRTREGTYSVNGETITLRCSNGENQTLECIEIEGRKYLCINNIMMIKGLLN